MKKFVSLKASGLSDAFDAEIHGDRPVVKVEEEKDRVEVMYVFPGFTMSEADHEVQGEHRPFKEVGVSGVGFVSATGKPLLPSFGRFVQIPSGCDFEFKVKKSKPVEFDELLVTPAQEEARDGVESEFEFDEEAYAEDAYYPDEIVEVTGPYQMDDYTVLLVHVRPLQYNAASRSLRGFSNITVSIKLSKGKSSETDTAGACPFLDPGANREGFGNLLLNPGRRIWERLPGIPPGPPVPFRLRPRGPEFLIIHALKLKEPAEKLAEWKMKRGLRTEIVPITQAGSTVAQIKTYIRGRRAQFLSRLRYVLLFGDVTDVPTEQVGGATTDHYYYTKTDATGDTDCIIPWVSGGRIPVPSTEEGNAVVDQIIRYEKRPPCDPEYYRRMTSAAFFQDDYPQDNRADRAYMKTMEGIRQHMLGEGFDVQRVYVSNNPNPQKYKDDTLVSQEVKDAIVDAPTATDMLISETSEGQLVVGHRDHGSQSGWVDPPFQIGHLQSITSQYPSIFFSVNCSTGRFDANPSDCFAEAILKLDGGAPSLIAATELSGTWRNDSLMKALFDSMWPGVIPSFPGTTASYSVKCNRLGDILNYAKSYLLVAHGANWGVKNHFEIYHVVGDPTVELWSRQPCSVGLRAWIKERILYITTGTCPAGSVVTLWYRGRLLKRMETSSTSIKIDLRDMPVWEPASFRRSLHVCFSAPGFRFAEVALRIWGEGPIF